MKNTVETTNMINYLQSMLNEFQNQKERYGKDERTMDLFHSMIACKEMVETLIGAPVNLQKDGKVTIGF